MVCRSPESSIHSSCVCFCFKKAFCWDWKESAGVMALALRAATPAQFVVLHIVFWVLPRVDIKHSTRSNPSTQSQEETFSTNTRVIPKCRARSHTWAPLGMALTQQNITLFSVSNLSHSWIFSCVKSQEPGTWVEVSHFPLIWPGVKISLHSTLEALLRPGSPNCRDKQWTYLCLCKVSRVVTQLNRNSPGSSASQD